MKHATNRNRRTPAEPLPSVQFYTFVAEPKSLAALHAPKDRAPCTIFQNRYHAREAARRCSKWHRQPPTLLLLPGWSSRRQSQSRAGSYPRHERQSARRADRSKPLIDSAASSLKFAYLLPFLRE